MKPRPAPGLAFGSLALLAFLCFRPALDYGFLVSSDDWDYVLANPVVRAGLTLHGLRWSLSAHAANWHPLAWLSHMADVTLFGLRPAGHHLTSLLLHAANAALLGCALYDLTGRAARSWLVAALFAVHPTRIESVVWVAERKDVLCGLFWILTTWAYVRATRSCGRFRLAPALAFFALGLASKPMIVTLPLLLLLLDAGPLARARDARALLERAREKLWFFALAAAATVATALAQGAGRAVQSLEAFPLAVRLGNVPLAYLSYLRTFVWPLGLSAHYAHPGSQLPWATAAAATLALALATAWALRSGRCALWAGWLWFLIALLPVIGLVQVGEQAHADRYSYVPYVGLWAAVVWGAADLLGRLRWPSPAAAGLSLLLVGLLVAATRAELPYWRDARTLYGRAVQLEPVNTFARQNLGVALLYDGRLADARHEFDRVLELRPESPFALRAAAEAATRAHDAPAAAGYLERLVRVTPDDPLALARLGDARVTQGELAAALQLYAAARRVAPAFTPAAYPYALALLADGQQDAALEQLQKAAAGSPERTDWAEQLVGARELVAGASGPERVRLERALAEVHRQLATGLRRRGRDAEALQHEQEAARLAP